MQNVASFLSFFGGFLNAYSESLFRNEVKGVFFMENNKKIKPNSYYSIQYWMINELGLKGLELSIYAIIYGFSRDHCGAFTGSRSYLADFTNSTTELCAICRSIFTLLLLIKQFRVHSAVMKYVLLCYPRTIAEIRRHHTGEKLFHCPFHPYINRKSLYSV